MTTFTLRRIKEHFVVTGWDFEPMKFKTRIEAKDWCCWHHPRVPMRSVGTGPGGWSEGRWEGRRRQSEHAMHAWADRQRPWR